MSGERLALKLHHALIEDLAEVQTELVKLTQAKAIFGSNTLPTDFIWRSGRNVLAEATTQCIRQEQRLWERYAELVQTIAKIEQVLIAQNDADLSAFADFISRRMKEAQSKK